MDSLTAEVAGLVEVALLLGLPGLDDGGDHLEKRTLRGHLLRREVETSTLVELERAEALDANGNAQRELASPGGPRHLDPGESRAADLRLEQTPIQRFEAHRAPPEAGEEERGCKEEQPGAVYRQSACRSQARGQKEPCVGLAEEEGECEADAESCGEEVRRGNTLETVAEHGGRGSQVDQGA